VPYLIVSSAYHLLGSLPDQNYKTSRGYFERALAICQRMKEIGNSDVVAAELKAMEEAIAELDQEEADRLKREQEAMEQVQDAPGASEDHPHDA